MPLIPGGFSDGRVKETVEPCLDLPSAVGDAAKVSTEPRREPCGIATTVSGDDTPGREFSEEDEDNVSVERR